MASTMSIWYTPGMDKHKQSAKTIRIETTDREAIAAIRDYYGVSSDNDAIRIALRELHRQIRAGGCLNAQAPNKDSLLSQGLKTGALRSVR